MAAYRPRHSAFYDRTRTLRFLLAAAVILEVLAATARVGGVVDPEASAKPPPAGVVFVKPGRVSAGGWTTLSFAVRADKAGIDSGTVAIDVPVGWSAPSTEVLAPGRVTASTGSVTIDGRTINVTGIRLLPSSTFLLTYGGGYGGATEPTQAGSYRFEASVIARNGTWVGQKLQSAVVAVTAPLYGCNSASRPAGVGGQLPLQNGVVQANLYNTWESAGSIRQCSGPTGVTNDLALAGLRATNYGPAGYPEVAYGYNLNDHSFCGSCPTRPFPVRISELLGDSNDLRLSLDYSLGKASPPTLPRDFIYDVWLERAARPDQPPAPGDVELIVFLYQQNIAACSDGTTPMPFSSVLTIDGKAVLSTWHACHIKGGTAATPVAFFLDTPAQSESGRLNLGLRDFVNAASTFLGQSLSDHSVLGVEVGGEFDQCSVQDGCQVPQLRWGWSVHELTILDGRGSVPVVFSQRQQGLG